MTRERNISTYTQKVLDIVASIPKGSVRSYGEVASLAGIPNGARRVGTIMAENTDKHIPCHRVVRSDGSLSGYNGLRGGEVGAIAKRKLLEKEGVIFSASGKVKLDRK